jgi:archaellum component FlaC
MNDTLLMVFIGVSSLAIIIQAAILAAMYATTKKTAEQVEKLATEVRTKALPAIESVQSMITDNRPRVEEIIENLAAATTTARSQLVRIDATLNDVLDRTRLQVIRADELATSTMDKIEETTDIVQHTIITPVRRINAVVSALSTGMGMFVAGRRSRKNGTPKRGGESEDMFI